MSNDINVLFIILDDLNDWVDFMAGEPGGGPPEAAGEFTPNMSALAASGTAFTRAYAASPICNPSRAAFLGGRRPGWTGIYDLNHDTETAYKARGIVPITKQLMNNGYEVNGFGKVYHPQNMTYIKSLFTSYSAGSGGGTGTLDLNGLDAKADDWGTPVNADTDVEMKDYKNATAAIAAINKTRSKPFAIFLGFHSPHLPLYVPKKYFDKFPLSNDLLPPTIANDLNDLPPEAKVLAEKSGFQNGERLSFAELKAAGLWDDYVRAYLAAIAFADGQVGRVMDALNASPHKDNTVVVLLGDNGYHIGEKDHLHKAALWERTLRVPLIFSGPGISAGRCSAPVDLMSVYPTLMALTDVPVPSSGLDGISVVNILENPLASASKPVAQSTYWDGEQTAVWSVRSKFFRYTLYADGGEELYDEVNDPNEWTNQASNPAFAANKATLKALIPTSVERNRPPVVNYNGSSSD